MLSFLLLLWIMIYKSRNLSDEKVNFYLPIVKTTSLPSIYLQKSLLRGNDGYATGRKKYTEKGSKSDKSGSPNLQLLPISKNRVLDKTTPQMGVGPIEPFHVSGA